LIDCPREDVVCDSNGNYIHEDDAIEVYTRYGTAYAHEEQDGIVELDEDHYDGVRWATDDIVTHCEWNDTYILTRDAQEVADIDGGYAHENDVITLADGNYVSLIWEESGDFIEVYIVRWGRSGIVELEQTTEICGDLYWMDDVIRIHNPEVPHWERTDVSDIDDPDELVTNGGHEFYRRENADFCDGLWQPKLSLFANVEEDGVCV